MFLCCSLLLCKRIAICVHLWRERGGGLIVARLLTVRALCGLLLGFYRHDVVRPDVINES